MADTPAQTVALVAVVTGTALIVMVLVATVKGHPGLAMVLVTV